MGLRIREDEIAVEVRNQEEELKLEFAVAFKAIKSYCLLDS